jgi:MFS family permease
MAILTLLIFVQGWAGTAGSVANAQISRALGVSKVAEDLTTALYLVGVGSGCVFVGPLSETVGRNPVYLISTFCYLFFVLGCALASTFGGQMVCRFFTGFFASATLGINGASVKDQFRPVKRSFVFPVIAWANVACESCGAMARVTAKTPIARVIAPVAGGWIVSSPHLDWRWCYWITFIISVFAFVVAVLFLPETYVPILLEWKAQHLRRVTGDNRYISQHAESASFLKRISERLPLGVTFFRTEPIVVVFGAYLVLIYILLFTFQSGFDYTFKQTYRLSTELTGSCFGAIAAGSTAFTFAAPALYSWARHKTEFVQGASIKPEFRLWPAVATAPLLPISLFWLGWTNYPSISIWSGLAACFVLGIAMKAIYVSSYAYIIDSYGKNAAVALSAITMARYLISSGMVMAARPRYYIPGTSLI